MTYYIFYQPPMPRDNNIIDQSYACQSRDRPTQGREVSLNHRYRAILNSIPSGYVYCRVLYDEGRPVDLMHEEVNVSWEKLTGIKDVTGRRFTEVFPGIAESNPEFFRRLLKVAETGITDHFEYYIDVLGKWFDNNVFSPEKGSLVSIIEDISQRKLAEEELRHSEERFSSLFEEHSSIMFMYDAEGNIVDANKAAADFYGWSIDELRGMSIRQINTLPPEAMQREIETWKSLKQKHRSFFHRKADGSVRNVELFAKKIRIKDRDLITAIIHDVTDQKLYEQVNAFRLHILQMADNHATEELLTTTLDEAEKITGSSVGFVFFVAEDQHSLQLQTVSTNTLEKLSEAPCTIRVRRFRRGKAIHQLLRFNFGTTRCTISQLFQLRIQSDNDNGSLPQEIFSLRLVIKFEKLNRNQRSFTVVPILRDSLR